MANEKISVATAKKILKMLEGDQLPSSALPKTVVTNLRNEELLGVVSHGSRSSYYLFNREASRQYIETYYLNGKSIENWIATMNSSEETVSRATLVKEVGDSKMLSVRTFRGFLVNSCEPIQIKVNNVTFNLSPIEGIATFIQDPETFRIPPDVVVVGIENGENFRRIRLQRHLFHAEKVLFVSRYPQSTDLRNWLTHIPNSYIHFGDFDLAGIHIYQTEIFKYIGNRSSFFIPNDIEARIVKGNKDLYDKQYAKFVNMEICDERLGPLVNLIHQYHRVYEQEGYIEESL